METSTDLPVTPVRSFEQFFAESWPWAMRLASLLVQDSSAGEDIAQDSLTTMAKRWGATDEPSAYLRVCVVNACRTWNRRASRHRAALPLLAGPAYADLGADELADAIAHLPFRQRAVIVMRFYAGLSEAEIAHSLGCRPGTVKSLSSRALSALSQEIER